MQNPDLSRRKFLFGKVDNTASIAVSASILPPWAEHNFFEKCTQCGDCIERCETRVLIKGERGYPEIRFTQAACSFCGECAAICRQPIFRPMSSEAWRHKIAINGDCLTRKQVACRSCQDSCEWRVISFKAIVGKVAQPQCNLDACNGCGACVTACPVQAVMMLNTQAE